MLISLLSVEPHRSELDRARLLGAHERSGPGFGFGPGRATTRRATFRPREHDERRTPIERRATSASFGERRPPRGEGAAAAGYSHSSPRGPARARYGDRGSFRRERSSSDAGGAPPREREAGSDAAAPTPVQHRSRSGTAYPAGSRSRTPRSRTGGSPPRNQSTSDDSPKRS